MSFRRPVTLSPPPFAVFVTIADDMFLFSLALLTVTVHVMDANRAASPSVTIVFDRFHPPLA